MRPIREKRRKRKKIGTVISVGLRVLSGTTLLAMGPEGDPFILGTRGVVIGRRGGKGLRDKC